MQEKRKQPRVAPTGGQLLPVQIVGGETVEIGVVHDISENGLGIRIAGGRVPTCAADTAVDVILVLPEVPPLTLRGVVRRVDDSEAAEGFYGLQITDIPADDLEPLHGYLQSQLTSDPGPAQT